MLGLSVNATVADEVARLLDENKLTLNGRRAAVIRDRFDRAVFPLRDDTDAVLTKIMISEIDEADPIIIEDFVVSTTIKAAERKKPAYSARGATAARKRFDDIYGNVIQRPRRRGAHKGWVTRLEWNELERLGLWSHEWVLQYVFDGHTYKMDGKAVCEDRAIRDILATAKTLAKHHRGASIRLAGWKKIVHKRLKDVTERSQKALERATK